MLTNGQLCAWSSGAAPRTSPLHGTCTARSPVEPYRRRDRPPRSGWAVPLRPRSGGALGARLSTGHPGTFEEALAADTEAARLYAALAARWPGRFTENLQRAIENLRIDYRDLGRTEADADALVREITGRTDTGT